jgi:cell division inhibitor SulA
LLFNHNATTVYLYSISTDALLRSTSPIFTEHIMSYSIEQIINRPDTWQGIDSHSHSRVILTTKSANTDWHNRQSVPTGFDCLNEELQLGGWPTHGAVEVLSDHDGAECMGLFLPTMQRLASEKRWQAFINAPHTPYAPLLRAHSIPTEQILMVHPKHRDETLWATEQAVRSTTCSAVFAWLGNTHFRYAEIRKLQLAAASTDTLLFLFRSSDALSESTPVSLRLHINNYREVSVVKQRGGKCEVDIRLPENPSLAPHITQPYSKAVATKTGVFLTPVA